MNTATLIIIAASKEGRSYESEWQKLWQQIVLEEPLAKLALVTVLRILRNERTVQLSNMRKHGGANLRTLTFTLVPSHNTVQSKIRAA